MGRIKIVKYDLNQDGFFAGEEITPQQEAAMIRVTNDLGRNYSFIAGIYFSFILSFPLYLVGIIIIQCLKVLRARRHP